MQARIRGMAQVFTVFANFLDIGAVTADAEHNTIAKIHRVDRAGINIPQAFYLALESGLLVRSPPKTLKVGGTFFFTCGNAVSARTRANVAAPSAGLRL